MVEPGDISIVFGPTMRLKLKSGGDGAGGVLVAVEVTELDVVEDATAVLEDVDVLDAEVEVVLAAGAF
jgi:hypothetical protein